MAFVKMQWKTDRDSLRVKVKTRIRNASDGAIGVKVKTSIRNATDGALGVSVTTSIRNYYP